MTEYDALFSQTAPDGRFFADKAALDPLSEPETVVAREFQQTTLAEFLNGVHHAYLPTMISVCGPPGTGKTLTTRRMCRAFATRTVCFAFEYVNLKECRTLFSAGNEILLEVAGEKLQAYHGLDDIFERLWDTLEAYPEYMMVILDEIDHIKQDSNYDPSEFFYRLLRGEGKLQRDLNLSVILISNELVDVELRLDSRVKSAMDGEKVLFPPYGIDELTQILTPQLERAFQPGVLLESVRAYGIREAARKCGDVRKALRLFRKSGETAVERVAGGVIKACISTNLHTTEREATVEKLLRLPFNHFHVLAGMANVFESSGEEIKQPVTTNEIVEALDSEHFRVGEGVVREVVIKLVTMGLVETWIESRGRQGRVKQITTTFDPQWVVDICDDYLEQTEQVDLDEFVDFRDLNWIS